MIIRLKGQYGLGDCIHQRAVIRDLMRAGHDVTLETCYTVLNDDLVRDGLQLSVFRNLEPRIREMDGRTPPAPRRPHHLTKHLKIGYDRETICTYGSILAAQYASVGLRMPASPDFSLQVPAKWRQMALERVTGRLRGRPLLVYRPSVFNNLWRSGARAPEPAAYAALFQSVRDRYAVVSIANLGDKGEYIDGPEQDADIKFHRGELSFEELVGLFAEAKMTFTCPGFAPILSQAVGTPTVIVYGGNESFRTTNSVGAHLAPTLAIEPANPCECHLKEHDCDKTLDVPTGIARIEAFERQCTH